MDTKPTTTVPVQIGDGLTIRIETASLGGREKVGILDSLPFQELMRGIEAVAESFGDSLKKIQPSKASVEFGVEVALEAGKLMAVICQGSGKANFTITLEWEKGPSPAVPSKL